MQYILDIKLILKEARQKTYQAIYSAMVEAYWKIGQQIVLEEQNGQQRAAYGKEVIKTLSQELTAEFGKGFSERSLREYRQFYTYLPDLQNWRKVFAILNWSHFQRVLRISNQDASHYYLKEAAENNNFKTKQNSFIQNLKLETI